MEVFVFKLQPRQLAIVEQVDEYVEGCLDVIFSRHWIATTLIHGRKSQIAHKLEKGLFFIVLKSFRVPELASEAKVNEVDLAWVILAYQDVFQL